jgi:diguanylate cyclase (GGDEF)-like protein/PAS domain S-box-containing protein
VRVRARRAFSPFDSSGRRVIAAILATFALSSAVTVGLSIWATSRAQHRATVFEVAARQRMLADRYVKEVLLVRAGADSDPGATAAVLRQSAAALLDGGIAPSVNGDDDETVVSGTSDPVVRAQLEQEARLVHDLTLTGSAIVTGRPVPLSETAHERLTTSDPIARLRILSDLTSNVSLNAARTIAADADHSVSELIVIQIGLGVAGLAVSLLLAFALVAATRRRTARFRSIVSASTDLVLVFGAGRCRYASDSVTATAGATAAEMLDEGYARFVHPDDLSEVRMAVSRARPSQLVFRMSNQFGEWRHLEARVTDLRDDRHVRGVVMNARDVSERVRLEDELTHQAYHDGLTGVANRVLFRDRLDQAIAIAVRTRASFAVLMLDLDGFKGVNDSLGHDAGDELLTAVARRLEDALRPGDTIARIGGDEFAFLLDGTEEEAAIDVAARLLARVSEPIEVSGRQLSLGASAGIAVHPRDGREAGELVRRADVAMYAAKEAGRGRAEIFRAELARELGESLGLEHEFRQALQRGELSVHYQPEVDLTTGAIAGVEALARWTSPTRGPVPPSQFIPIAEATGLILPLGELVLREACRQTADWERRGLLPPEFVTWVNVSARQLAGSGLTAVVRDALDRAGLDAHRLGLEVTETAIVAKGVASEHARTELQWLHEAGVRLAVDDFGTGFSSLGQLRHFPVDVIKVDRSFVQGVGVDPKDAAITANVVGLAHALGLQAVAEGIESDEQLLSLRTLGCDLAQGFLFARPAPPREIELLLSGGEPLTEAA